MDAPSLPVTDSICLVTRMLPNKAIQPAETNATTGRMDDSFDYGRKVQKIIGQSITYPVL